MGSRNQFLHFINRIICKLVGHLMDENSFRQGGCMCGRCGYFIEHPSWKIQ